MGRHGPLVAAAIATLMTALATPAGAQDAADDAQATPQVDPDSDAQAREHFRRASELHDAGDYEAAAREFQIAYELSNRPELLFNLYVAHERLGDLEAAGSYLRRFLEEGDAGDREDALVARLAHLDERLEAARAEAQQRSEEEQRRAEERARLRREAEAGDPGALPWILTAGGGALVVGGVVLLLMSQSDVSAVENPDGAEPRWSDVEAAYDRAPVLSTTGGILLGVGGAALAVGLSWALLSGGGGGDVDVAVGPGGVTVRGRM